MTTASTYLDYKFDLVTINTRVYAPTSFEQTFNTLGAGQAAGSPVQGPVPALHLLAGQAGSRAASNPSADDLLAVKAAEQVANWLADDARAAMGDLEDEFLTDAFVREAGRWAANLLVPTLQPLDQTRRREVAALATDPVDCGEDLDLVLDGVGRMLETYCDYLPSPQWVPLPTFPDGTTDARVVGWCGPGGAVVLDLVDTVGPDHAAGRDAGAPFVEAVGPLQQAEIANVLHVGQRQHGSHLSAVRFLPTYAMSRARVHYPNGNWHAFVSTPPPVLRLVR